MQVQECYYDGCNGQKTGDSFEGSVEECADWLVELDTEDDPQTEADVGRSLNGWTKDDAVTELNRCLEESESLYIDFNGDQQWWLVVT